MTNLPQTSLEKGLGKFWKIFCWNFSDLEQNDVELFIKSSHHVCQNYILRVWKMFWCWFLLIFRWVLSYFAKKYILKLLIKIFQLAGQCWNLRVCWNFMRKHIILKKIYISRTVIFRKLNKKHLYFPGKKLSSALWKLQSFEPEETVGFSELN